MSPSYRRTPRCAPASAFRAVFLIPLLILGCGGEDGGPSPTQPPPPAPPPQQPSIASITIDLGETGMEVGQAVSPEAVARSADGTVVQTAFTWSSTAPEVATVSSSGEVRGRTAGTATIRATADGVTGSLDLSVAPMDLTALVTGIQTARGLPSLGGAIVTRDGLVGIAVAGDRRAGSGPPVTLEDRWHIGSNLKAKTGALAAIAVSRGALSWDRTVVEAFPELDASIRTEYRHVTLRDLLANRGRIRNDPPPGTYAGSTPRAQRESMVAWALAAPPIGPSGAFHYSNPGFVVAGAMLERALGGDFEELMASEFMQPIGATSLGWGPTTGPGGTDQPVGHRPAGGGWSPCEACDNPPGLSAAGRAHMSLGDWARVVQELLKADHGTSALIDAAHGRTMFTGVTGVPGSQDQYALGWFMTSRTWGGRTATHTGSNVSNHSVAWLGLDTGVGFLAVTNAADLTQGGTGASLDALVVAMLERWQALP